MKSKFANGGLSKRDALKKWRVKIVHTDAKWGSPPKNSTPNKGISTPLTVVTSAPKVANAGRTGENTVESIMVVALTNVGSNSHDT